MPHGEGASQTQGRVLHGARLYRLFEWVIAGRRRELVELSAPRPGETVLDIGCGPGSLTLALKEEVASGEVHGFDASPEMIEVASERARKSGSQIDFKVALIEDLPLADSCIDLVTSSLMLHHLPDDVKRAGIAEVRRVLKPGGRLVVMDFARESHSVTGHLLRHLGRAHGEDTLAKLVPLLKEAGFATVETVTPPHRSLAFLRAR
jgi:ubiquinone/menaquinone biosynthesis C-methylase UbiE